MADEQDLMEESTVDDQIAALQKKTKMLMMGIVVAIGIGAGSGAFAVMQTGKLGGEVESVRQVAEKIDAGREEAIEELAKPEREVGVIHPLGNFVVNLLDPGNLRYVNCRIEVEVEDSAIVKEINGREAQFKDAVISLLGNQTYEDMLGTEGKSRLREELMVRFNRLLPKGQVSRVYLTELVVQ